MASKRPMVGTCLRELSEVRFSGLANASSTAGDVLVKSRESSLREALSPPPGQRSVKREGSRCARQVLRLARPESVSLIADSPCPLTGLLAPPP